MRWRHVYLRPLPTATNSPATQHPTRASSSFGFKCFGLGHQIETLCKFCSLSMATYLFVPLQSVDEPAAISATCASPSCISIMAETIRRVARTTVWLLLWLSLIRSGEPWQSGCQPFFSLWIWCGPPLSSFRISFSLLGKTLDIFDVAGHSFCTENVETCRIMSA